jgi:hypothetical protein
MKKLLLGVLAIIVIGFISSCGCGNNPTQFPIHQPLLDYVDVYQPGNWWVYIDSTNGLKDSVFVISTEVSYTQDDFCDEYETIRPEIFQQYLFSSLSPVIVDTTTFHIQRNTNQNQSGFLVTSPVYISYNENLNLFFNNYSEELSIVDTMGFENVIKFESTNEIKYYFAPNVGIIAFTNNDGSFSLTNYEIQ